jgi:drug/metabolite transporter (DMT)-like permease
MSMTPQTTFVVLLAAVLHASWNALVKVSGDRLLTQTVIIATGFLLCAPLLPFVALPARESVPFLVASVAIHNVYFLFLLQSYRFGDLSQVYPILRGSAPLVVALLSAPVAAEMLSPTNFAGVLLVGCGILSLSLRGPAEQAYDSRAVSYALGTGLLIAAFTLVDGLGVRRSGNALAFSLWLEAFEVWPLLVFAVLRRRARVLPYLRRHGRQALLGGVMATAAYLLVLSAFSRAPIAAVSALRETSVVMAALIGAIRLREPFGLRRVIAAAVVALGAALINLSR